MFEEKYTSGDYLKNNPSWLKESPEATQETAFFYETGFHCSTLRRMEPASVSQMI